MMYRFLTTAVLIGTFLVFGSCVPGEQPDSKSAQTDPAETVKAAEQKVEEETGLSPDEYLSLPVWETIGGLYADLAALEQADTYSAVKNSLSPAVFAWRESAENLSGLELSTDAQELNQLAGKYCGIIATSLEGFAAHGNPVTLVGLKEADQLLEQMLSSAASLSPEGYSEFESRFLIGGAGRESALGLGRRLYDLAIELILVDPVLDEEENVQEICEEIVAQAAEEGTLNRLESILEAEVEAGRASPAVLFTLSAVYGRKGMKREAYEMLVQVEEEVKQRPKVVFNLAAIHGRKNQLKTELDAEAIKFRTPEGFVAVKGGRFRFGADVGFGVEGPDRFVVVGDFFIMKEEVNFQQYDRFCRATGRPLPDDQGWGRDEQPVINVTWHDAVAYCNWLSEENGFDPSYTINGTRVTCDFDADGFRLPTEAEWEYAARGGEKSLGTSFSGNNDAGSVGWFMDNSEGRPHPGGQLTANELGIYDMSGNVWEWCWDWYEEYKGSFQVNPSGPASGELKTLRGGSWSYFEEDMAVSSRGRVYPDDRDANNGFRLVQSIR